jgi:hypothetical protein
VEFPRNSEGITTFRNGNKYHHIVDVVLRSTAPN